MHPDLTRWGGGFVLALVLGILPGCASTGSASPSARPVLYPNATLHRVGDAQGRAEADACMARAMQAGLTSAENTHAVARGAGVGAATGGVAAAVGALITGRGTEGVIRAGAGGAAVGGSAGAVQGAFRNDRPSSTYRAYVQRCLADKGFDVIGWN
ncbi:MAG: glycine zipper family protein [Polaromonas sp.]|uniref:glycine zipper family protein n=1 Tax=Polaromonas sp. TaxID=1869339 RepID=UPI00272FCF9A|nr:glycine zipper family protein [Polaromonas sp.]MDP2448299.1 glycine zipper family protein [Polaromonas sp.]MDP3249643.1 glycine zipper family protein [Polaromonas sp.]MDP3754311.1 glycine zipper family protein [Polaromonas sp.]MDP3825394.1 glycine zipper family protein [Polaromonas sp.]